VSDVARARHSMLFALPISLLVGLGSVPTGALGATDAPARPRLVDPTRPDRPATPSRAAKGERHEMALTAIVFSEGRRIAVVNGRKVRVGETIAGVRVEDIGARHVRLRDGQRSFTIKLNDFEVKKEAGGEPGAGSPDRRAPVVSAPKNVHDHEAGVR